MTKTTYTEYTGTIEITCTKTEFTKEERIASAEWKIANAKKELAALVGKTGRKANDDRRFYTRELENGELELRWATEA